MERLIMGMADPIFGPGESRVATVTFPVRPAGLNGTVELWLSRDGTAKDATSGVIPFTSTGVDQDINCPIVMPEGGFAYQVLIDRVVEGTIYPGYLADEPVIIPWVGPPVVTW